MQQLLKMSAVEMASALRNGDCSAVELARAHLQHIKATNETLNSFITITEDFALAAAARADEQLSRAPDSASPLCGIPVAIKDMLVTQGVETTCGSKMLRGFVPPYDSTAVRRLNRQGAVMVGKTNLDEFAMGSSNEYSAFGPVRNPWETDRVPGGTSGGSAAAVAAGQAPISLGTDTGGSVRQPAAFCGVYGLKPTYGRVSRYGVVAHASSLDQVGPIARSVEDLALTMNAISGKDTHDSTSMDIPVADYHAELMQSRDDGLRGLRVGIPKEFSLEGVQPEVRECFQATLQQLSNLGAQIVEISLPHVEYSLACYYIIVPAEASSNMARYDGVRYGFREASADTLSAMYEQTRALGFGPEVKRRIVMGSYVLSRGYYDEYYLKAQQVRTLIINDFKAAFANHCDIIVSPTSPTTAFKLGEKLKSPLTMYLADVFTVPVNLSGIPAISLPAGQDGDGLPIGFQCIAPPFSESLLLRVADSLAREINFDSGARILPQN